MGLSIMMCLGDLAYVSKMKTKPGWEVLSIKKLRIWIWLIDLTHHQDTKQPPKTFQILSKHPPINFKPSRSRFSTVREKAEWYGDNACRMKWRLLKYNSNPNFQTIQTSNLALWNELVFECIRTTLPYLIGLMFPEKLLYKLKLGLSVKL